MAETGTEQTQILAEVDRITFRNEDNGWTVTKMRRAESADLVTVTGAFAAICEGQSFQLFGIWQNHPQYGKQFRVERSVPLRPTSKEGILRYLASGLIKGVGPKTAAKIVKHFGEQTLDILDKDIARLREVKAVGSDKVNKIITTWQKDRTINNILLFLNAHGISALFAHKILKLYGEHAIDIVSRDPYRLANDIQGIGFKSADKIAAEIGIARDSLERIRAAVLYQLKQAEDTGHCFLTNEQMRASLSQLLELHEVDLEPKLLDALNVLNQLGNIFSERMHDLETGATNAHYRTATLVAEVNLAENICTLLQRAMPVDRARAENWLERFCTSTNIKLSPSQSAAVLAAVENRVFILTGGPGVGKTTTANAIIRLLKAMGKTVALCAPTGRAAQRLCEVASMPARTIHRLLEWRPHERGFLFNETNPLTVQAVIVDESSMLDVHLADALLRAVPKNAQIIFIGDVDQLPSVGPGNFLKDMLDSKRVPYVALTEVFRQAEQSAIIRSAHKINHGEMPDFEMGSDCRFIEVESPQHILGVIKALTHEKIPQELGVSSARDIQILTPMNRGELGTQFMNDELQNLLNPKRPGVGELKRGMLTFRAGDKVIQMVNNYDLGVFNGDIGFVDASNVDNRKLIVRFGDRLVPYKDEQALELRLAYAITIHKSQGSEFPVVIIPISMQHFIMLQRNLVYTGLTRSKKLAVFVGTRKALSYAVRNHKSSKRQTLLLDRIQKKIT